MSGEAENVMEEASRGNAASVEVEDHEDTDEDQSGTQNGVTEPAKKKKKSKKKKLKEALTGQKDAESSKAAVTEPQISSEQLKKLAAINPSLKDELERQNPTDLQEFLKKLSLGDFVTGVVSIFSISARSTCSSERTCA